MGWINCPKCGAVGAGWEDDNSVCFCGKCEEEYQQAQAEYERQAAEDNRLRGGRIVYPECFDEEGE